MDKLTYSEIKDKAIGTYKFTDTMRRKLTKEEMQDLLNDILADKKTMEEKLFDLMIRVNVLEMEQRISDHNRLANKAGRLYTRSLAAIAKLIKHLGLVKHG